MDFPFHEAPHGGLFSYNDSMDHLQLFIDILSSYIALFSVLSGIIVFKLYRRRETLIRLVMTLGFLFVIVSFAYSQYLFNIASEYYSREIFAPMLGVFILIPSMAAYSNEINPPKRKKLLNVFFLVLTAATVILVFLSRSFQWRGLNSIASTLGLGLSICYICGRFAFLKSNHLTKHIGIIRRITGILGLAFLPLFTLGDVLGFIKVNMVSIFFLLWAACLIYEDILTIFYANKESRIESFTASKGLTPREHETMILLIKGYKYQEIADLLFISKETVKSHIKKIYSKCRVSNKIELIRVVEKRSSP